MSRVKFKLIGFLYMTHPTTPEVSEHSSRTRSLFDFYMQISGSSYRNPERGREMMRQFVQERHNYTGPVDAWYNLSAEAGRLTMPECGLLVTEEGLREHPNSVDLLCDQLSDYYGFFRDEDKARSVWEKLNSLEESKRYWRYWVFGATYHARLLQDLDKALHLLEQGLLHVSSDSINNIVRAYRGVLIDSPPSPIPSDRQSREEQETRAFKQMEELYKWAISLGVEEGHSLAVELAKLYQEKAGQQSTSDKERVDFLQESLNYLDYAEKMFISRGENHPVWDIYLPKARILMGLRRYSDALKLFKVLPKTVVDRNASISVQMRLAAEMLGEPLNHLEEGEAAVSPKTRVSVEELISQEPQQFFSELASLAQQNDSILGILKKIVGTV
jgi:tetratricopeptide (TPR) repeat protein